MDTEIPANAAGHAERPAGWLAGGAWLDLDLGSERAGRRLLVQRCSQFRRHAAQALQGQEAVRQKTQRRMVVEARPGTSLKMVQAQLLFELLIALLDVPARLPEADSIRQCRCRWQIGECVADRSVTAPLHQQPARFGLYVRYIIGSPSMLPAMRRPHAHPGKLGVQRTFGPVTNAMSSASLARKRCSTRRPPRPSASALSPDTASVTTPFRARAPTSRL